MENQIRFIPREELIPTYVLQVMSETMDWGMMLAGVPEAHKITRGAGIKVAVLDTGISPHPDLLGGVAVGIDCTNTSPGAIDLVVGHGIHVAGIIAARQNDFGIIGIAPECTVIPIKVLGEGGHGGFGAIEAGIRAAMSVGADIINMSLGTTFVPPESLHAAVREAAARGIIIVAAAGNDSGAVNYPARYDEIIAVAALDRCGELARFSSRGSEVDAGAPGVDIYSTYLSGQYALLNGTSQASPFIAGVCALILSWSRKNNIVIKGYQDMIQRLDDLSDDGGRVGTWGDRAMGFGVPSFANSTSRAWTAR